MVSPWRREAVMDFFFYWYYAKGNSDMEICEDIVCI